MKPSLTSGLALAALCAASTLAYARPPTVMNSPGYDRRLQESRSQLGATVPVTPNASVAKPKPSKKKQPN